MDSYIAEFCLDLDRLRRETEQLTFHRQIVQVLDDAATTNAWVSQPNLLIRCIFQWYSDGLAIGLRRIMEPGTAYASLRSIMDNLRQGRPVLTWASHRECWREASPHTLEVGEDVVREAWLARAGDKDRLTEARINELYRGLSDAWQPLKPWVDERLAHANFKSTASRPPNADLDRLLSEALRIERELHYMANGSEPPNDFGASADDARKALYMPWLIDWYTSHSLRTSALPPWANPLDARNT